MWLRMLFVVAIAGSAGCSNPCEELAERVCDKAKDNLATCEGVEDEAACKRLEAVVASCKTLTEKAATSSDTDRVACKADLELIRALEKQQQ